MSIKLSYILPCYNVERYVADCLDSIFAQDMPEEEYEVICVNDCSTDKTRSIIVEYGEKHANLTLIDHKINSGCGGIPRNTGVKNAHGDFICFVDADDFLPQDVMKSICIVAIKEKLDVLLYNHVIFANGGYKEKVARYVDSDVLPGGTFVERYLNGNIGRAGSAWANLYNRTFLLQHSIWHTDLVLSEDTVFSWEAMICAKRVKSISTIGYIFRSNEWSTTAGGNVMKPQMIYAASILYPNVLISLVNRYGETVPEVIQKCIANAIKTEIGGFFVKYMRCMEGGRRMLYLMIRNEIVMVDNLHKHMNRKQKIAFASRKMGYVVFNTVIKILYAR